MMITQKYLKEALHYDKDSGVFTWKIRPLSHFESERSMKIFNSRHAGEVAGHKHESCGKSYTRIGIGNSRHRAGRLAILYELGFYPEYVEFLDGDGENVRFDNLSLSNKSVVAKKHYKGNQHTGMLKNIDSTRCI